MTTHRDVQNYVQDWWRRDEQEFVEKVRHQREARARRRAAEPGQPVSFPTDVEEMVAEGDQQRHYRDQIPVGAYLASVDPSEDDQTITTNQLCVVAEVGHDLLYAAVWQADEQDDAEFFETAFGHWGSLIDAAIAECDLPARCHRCGNVLPDDRRCDHAR